MQFYPIHELHDLVENFELLDQNFGFVPAGFHDFDLTVIEFDGKDLFLTLDLKEHEFSWRAKLKLSNAQIKNLHILSNISATCTINDVLLSVDGDKLVFVVSSCIFTGRGDKSYLEVLCDKITITKAEKVTLWIRNPKY